MILGRDNNKLVLGIGDQLKSKFTNSEINKDDVLKIVKLEYFIPENELGLYFEGKDMGYTFNTDNYLFYFYGEWKEYKEIIN